MDYQRHRTNHHLLKYNGHFELKRRIDGSIITSLGNEGSILEYESISDSSHPGWKSPDSNDVGGPMKLIRERVVSGPGYANTRLVSGGPTTGIIEDYKGTLFPMHPMIMTYPDDPASSLEVLNELGAQAIAETAPGNSAFDAWEALGDLYRDGLPKSTFDTLKPRAAQFKSVRSKDIGSDWLNINFGWKPLVSDVMAAAATFKDAASILEQLERDAGRKVRRKRLIKEELSESTFQHIGTGAPSIGGISYNPGGFGEYWVETRTYRKIWFSASFTYYIPGDVHSRNMIIRNVAKANALYGIEITPKRLWELAPWSWMADWFTNAGEVISNVERFSSGNLVMNYGYLMEHSYTDHEYYFEPWVGAGNGASAPAVILRTESKQRVQANPFGFGVTWDGLSALQLSILAALGITRK